VALRHGILSVSLLAAAGACALAVGVAAGVGLRAACEVAGRALDLVWRPDAGVDRG